MGTLGNTQNLADQLKGIVDAGQAKVEDVRGKIIDGKDAVRDRAYRTWDMVSDTIKEHPLKAVGIAFAVGFVAMRILR